VYTLPLAPTAGDHIQVDKFELHFRTSPARRQHKISVMGVTGGIKPGLWTGQESLD